MKQRHQLLDIPEIGDKRGRLVFAQENAHIPFVVRRIFVIYDVPIGLRRGGHAHHRQHQFLMMTSGSSKVCVNYGVEKVDLNLDRPSRALYVPPMLWLDLEDFTENAVCLVLASGVYDEADYIRDYDEFTMLLAAQG